MLPDALNQPGIAALLFICLSSPAGAQRDALVARNQAETRAEVRAVLGAFRRAIIAKDEAGFLALFDAGPVVWQSVDSAATRAARGVPYRELASRDPEKTPQSFIGNIAASQARIDKTMSNIRVVSDGEIASASFDFVYSRGGKPTNHGLQA